MHAMKIAFWYFKEFYRAIREIYEKERLHNRVAFGMEVSFQDRKQGNTPEFTSIKIWSFYLDY